MIVATLVAGGLMVGAVGAYACTNLATIDIKVKKAYPGQTVEVTGKDFSGTLATPVEVHWNALDGALRWAGEADLSGNVAFSFKVPKNAKPGKYYTVVATQYSKTSGKPTYGTPARASIKVVAPTAPYTQ
ncbi:MAG: hypothetical protein ABR575_00955 [Actinomycetota bacterium]